MKPLTALVSQALVAFVIECDSRFEERVPHRTTLEKAGSDLALPWLVSVGMWALYLRHVGDGVSVREFARRAGLSREGVRNVLVRSIRWWGYAEIVKPATGSHDDRSTWTVRPSPGGRAAFDVWRTLASDVEERWRRRFGSEAIAKLRDGLERLDDAFRAGDGFLPIGHYGMFVRPGRSGAPFEAPLPLYVLFSRLLVVAAMEIERDSKLSMAIGDNVVRAIAHDGCDIRDLPLATGLSPRAVASSLTFLRGQELGVETKRGRTRAFCLTSQGNDAWAQLERRRTTVENDWRQRFGTREMDRLRELLESILDSHDGATSRFGSGLIPPPHGWRNMRPYSRQTEAFVADPARHLPHFPVVAHRGAWPDGS